jgi:uncharacterized repeat protein (TIGR01451 family)
MKIYMKNQESHLNKVKTSNRILLKSFATFFFSIILVLLSISSSYSQHFRIVQSGPSVSNPGDVITYVIAVKNSGNTLSDAIITTQLPSANLYTYISSKPSGVYNEENNTVKWDKTNNPELTSFANGEIYVTVTIKIGTKVSGEYKVPDILTKLLSYTTLESDHLKTLIKGNEIIIDVPKAGGAVLPVE